VIVVDASVLVAALGDDGHSGQIARQRLRNEHLVAPEIIDLEVISVLRRMVAARLVSDVRGDQAVLDLVSIRMTRVPHRLVVKRCWDLRNNSTPYDAAYIAVAEAFQLNLVTADAKLAGVPGTNCKVELLTS
jgi:predicted nucleic acid-binding protein